MWDQEEASEIPSWKERCYFAPYLIRKTRKSRHSTLDGYEDLQQERAPREEDADSHGLPSLASYHQVEVVVLSPRDGWGRVGELPVNLTERVSERPEKATISIPKKCDSFTLMCCTT